MTKTMVFSEQKKNRPFHPIAVVGMGGLFPGAGNLTEYWENILNGKDCIEDVPKDFWDIDPFYDANPLAPDKTYCKRGGFLPECEFDALEFGIPPKNLEAISMNQLLALKVAKDVLLDARMIGTDPIAYNKDKVGVILGAAVGHNAFFLRERLVGHHHFEEALKHFGMADEMVEKVIHHLKEQSIEWQENSFPGYIPNIVSGRIANRFDFGGVNYAVDAACASSLCAITQAVYELHAGNCDIVLTGGVSVMTDPGAFTSFSKTPALSLKNQIRPFDKDADGMIMGDGVGMIVLKRLEDAEAAGDKIYAVIRGMGASSDGRAKSIYAPRAEGQVSCLKRAYDTSDVNPAHVQLIEGHGTGTVAGDLIEIEGLKTFFGACGLPPQSIGLGSVKSQIGHTVMAAGVASTIKTVLALHHKIIPPMINCDEPHPDFELEKTPCYISTKALPWVVSPDRKRTAGVNSFGFGGVNYHLILEEYDRDHRAAYRINRLPESLVISAASSDELISRCIQMKDTLRQSDPDHAGAILSQYDSHTAPADHPRLGLVASDLKSTLEKLEKGIERLKKDPGQSWRLPAGISYRPGAIPGDAKIVALFPGQGAQYPDMGIDIARNYPEMLEAFQSMDSLFGDGENSGISPMVYPIPFFDRRKEEANAQDLSKTRNAQPALAAFCSGLYRIIVNLGFKPDILIGHSFGELTALWAAGAIDTPTFYRLSMMRGLVMQKTADNKDDPGKMLAVKDPPADMETIIGGIRDVYISNYNSPAQVVISGSSSGILQLEKKLTEMNIKTKMLTVSCAFHSLFMKDARIEFADALNHLAFKKTAIPVYNNLTAKPYSDKAETYSGILADHLQNPILFSQSIEAAYQAGGRVFVEFGPRRVLSAFVHDILKDRPVEIVSMIHSGQKNSLDQMMEAITQLRVLGLPLTGDPYRLEQNRDSERENAKKLTVFLKGQQYLTPETKARMRKAREKDAAFEPLWQNPAPQAELKDAGPQLPLTKKTTIEGETMQPSPAGNNLAEEKVTVTNTTDLHALDRIIHNQIANSRLQELFLQNQAKELELIDKLADRQNSLFNNGVNTDQLNDISLIHGRHMEFIQKTHDDFFAAHLAFLNQQQLLLARMTGDRTLQETACRIPQKVENLTGSINLATASVSLPSHNLHSLPVRESVQSATGMGVALQKETAPRDQDIASFITRELLAIVSDKTGYPVDMLELSMNIEADLGIDSIKRVEIFSALHEKMPHLLENIELTDLGEIYTLQDVITFLADNSKKNEGKTASADLAKPFFVGKVPVDETIPACITSVTEITKTLLAIVSEKTGYPSDMLELSMNIEADLGIDSIKRVEIFSALHEKMPSLLANIELTDLGEIYTLQDVIAFLAQASMKTQEPSIVQNNATEPARETAPDKTSLRYTVHTEAIDLPEMDKHLLLLSDHHILITEDGSGAGVALKERLKTMGHPSTLLEFTEYPAPIDSAVDFSVSLAALNDLAIKELLDDIREKNGPIGGFIHIAPLRHAPGHPTNYVDRWEGKLLKTVFFMAKHLKESLSSACESGRSFFVTVTRIDGQLGMNGIPARSIIQGGYAGLVKSLKLEAPRVFCRSIDIAPDFEAEAIGALITEELCDPSEWPVEIGRVSKETRFTIGKEEKHLNGNGNSDFRPDQATVFLVTGGGRGITARCVEGLAERFKSRYILLGRTAIDAEPVWTASCTDEESLKNAIISHLRDNHRKPTPAAINRELKNILSRREIHQTLARIHASGGKAVYINADITRMDDLKEKLSGVVDAFGPITGIIHGAGNLADKFLEKKSEADFDIVYHTKVTGLKTIFDCVDTSAIRYLILFSSISGYYGKDGQADYALSNEILNKVSHAFSKHHPDACIRSINWGPWDGGMVSSELKDWYKKFGIDVIPVKEGVEFLVNELFHAKAGNSQIVICPKSLELLVEQFKGHIS